MKVPIHEAKTHLSRLIAAVERGEEVVIARRDKPVVRLVKEAAKKRERKLGALAGSLSVELVEHLTDNPALEQAIEDDFMASVEGLSCECKNLRSGTGVPWSKSNFIPQMEEAMPR